MRIGIIGAGNIGGTLTRRLTELDHDVTVANSRGPASLMLLARETGARAGSVEEAVRSADLVVLAVPLKAVSELARRHVQRPRPRRRLQLLPRARRRHPRAGEAAQRVVGVGGPPVPRRARGQGVQHDRVHAPVRARHPARHGRAPRPAGGGRRPRGEAAGDGAGRRAGVRRRRRGLARRVVAPAARHPGVQPRPRRRSGARRAFTAPERRTRGSPRPPRRPPRARSSTTTR